MFSLVIPELISVSPLAPVGHFHPKMLPPRVSQYVCSGLVAAASILNSHSNFPHSIYHLLTIFSKDER